MGFLGDTSVPKGLDILLTLAYCSTMSQMWERSSVLCVEYYLRLRLMPIFNIERNSIIFGTSSA
jgi:hypothetical protein